MVRTIDEQHNNFCLHHFLAYFLFASNVFQTDPYIKKKIDESK